MLDGSLKKTPVPPQYGPLADFAPIAEGARSLWLLLFGDGTLVRFDADSGECTPVARVRTTVEEEREHPRAAPRTRLHASKRGEFAAVCRDYGQFGEVVDLRSGKVTLSLDGGAYHCDTVPFSFAFAEIDGRVVAVHRSDWNRLDLSDPASGEALSPRERTSKEHGLDYFHGELYLSPDHRRVLDDGWVWHPVGIPAAWDLERWLMDNPWESEDGPSRLDLCIRAYFWGGGMAWLDERRVAVEGLGDDDQSMKPGARIFDVTAKSPPAEGEPPSALELFAFPGPQGGFFASRGRLFSADGKDLSVWNPEKGEQLGRVPGFSPTHQHVDANELACVVQGVLTRWACPA